MARVPGHVNRDDLTSAGMLALVQAAHAPSTPSAACRFATYAATRIRGAIVDELRGIDWAQPLGTPPRPPGRRRPAAGSPPPLGRPAERRRGRRPRWASASTSSPRNDDDVARAAGALAAGLRGPALDDLLPAARRPPADVPSSASGSPTCTTRWPSCPSGCASSSRATSSRERPMAEIAAELGVSRVPGLPAARRGAGAAARRAEPRARARPGRARTSGPSGCAARRKEAYYASVAVAPQLRGAGSTRRTPRRGYAHPPDRSVDEKLLPEPPQFGCGSCRSSQSSTAHGRAEFRTRIPRRKSS